MGYRITQRHVFEVQFAFFNFGKDKFQSQSTLLSELCLNLLDSDTKKQIVIPNFLTQERLASGYPKIHSHFCYNTTVYCLCEDFFELKIAKADLSVTSPKTEFIDVSFMKGTNLLLAASSHNTKSLHVKPSKMFLSYDDTEDFFWLVKSFSGINILTHSSSHEQVELMDSSFRMEFNRIYSAHAISKQRLFIL